MTIDNAKMLHVEAGVRYWEDATVNGVEDTDGILIPCRDGYSWTPIIDLAKGKIINWQTGVAADIHYKVADAGIYILKDADDNEIARIENDYVPDILCPEEEGYGDYIIMKVSADGQIQNWKITPDEFVSQPKD